MVVALPERARGAHQQPLAGRAPAPLGSSALVVDGPARAPHSGTHQRPARGLALQKLLRADHVVAHALHRRHRRPSRPRRRPPSDAASALRRPGDVDLVRQPLRRGQHRRRSSPRPTRPASRTLYIKSSDGASNYWTQFSPQLVAELHARGLKVCAWQYVYGTNPAGEADARRRGRGRRRRLPGDRRRGRVRRPLRGRADLPRRPAGQDRRRATRSGSPPSRTSTTTRPSPTRSSSARAGPSSTLPQMYWKDIGDSVDTVYANTYIANRIYGRPIYPLGPDLRRRRRAQNCCASARRPSTTARTGLSFWDWQETARRGLDDARRRRWRR